MMFHLFTATRRALLALAVASTAALAAITSTPAHAAPPAQQKTQVPGYYRMALGDFKDRLWVAGAHLPFPGLGHVRAEPRGYAWVPIEYGPIREGR